MFPSTSRRLMLERASANANRRWAMYGVAALLACFVVANIWFVAKSWIGSPDINTTTVIAPNANPLTHAAGGAATAAPYISLPASPSTPPRVQTDTIRLETPPAPTPYISVPLPGAPAPTPTPPPTPPPAPEQRRTLPPAPTPPAPLLPAAMAAAVTPVVIRAPHRVHTHDNVAPESDHSIAPAGQHREQCANDFDYALLDKWSGTARTFCAPLRTAPTTPAVPATSSWLVCRSTNKPFMPPPTGPHTVCEASNIVMDVRRARLSFCCKHRPGYFCDGAATYYQYDSGFITPAFGCTRDQSFVLPAFPRDHLMDLFDSWPGSDQSFDPTTKLARVVSELTTKATSSPRVPISTAPAADGRVLARLDGVTLFVTRERGEHKNLFHTFTDLLNAYSTLYQLSTPSPPVVASTDAHYPDAALAVDVNAVRVVFLDAHIASRYDDMWNAAFSRAAPAVHIAELAAAAATTDASPVGGAAPAPALLLFPRALFSPPGYSSLLFAALHERTTACPYRLDVLSGFVHHFLASYGLKHQLDTGHSRHQSTHQLPTPAGVVLPTPIPVLSTLRVSLIVRRPYDLKPKPGAGGGGPSSAHGGAGGRDRLDRQFGDEPGLIAALESLSGTAMVGGATLVIDVVDFATHTSVAQQLAQAAATDVMIGIHGAGLAHVLWLPDHAGLLEIRAQALGWYCFVHMAEWRGLEVRTWEYSKDQTTVTSTDEYVRIDPHQFKTRAAELIKIVAERKLNAIKRHATTAAEKKQ